METDISIVVYEREDKWKKKQSLKTLIADYKTHTTTNK